MGCNPCCCFNLKDSAVTIGIWTVVFSITQLGIMGWQMAAIKYEKDRAANTLLPNYNTYGRYDIPSYYESYWQSPEERYYTGLFVIQILCLISAFFLLFASVALIYGVHTWSRYLVWPWFPCIISSILCSLAYCIMWWAGDVRDYWMALTILEIIGVFINVYCVVVVLMYYRRITSATDEYEGKDRRIRYKVNQNGYSSRRDLLQSYDGLHNRSPETVKPPYPNYNQPVHQPYPAPYSPSGVPQTPIPLPPNYTPYPPDVNEVLAYPHEPKRPVAFEPPIEDPVSHWVRSQQKIDRGEANSEPISPSREVAATFPAPLKHSRSVPSMYDGTLVSHKDCRHRKHHHRSSSRRHRSRSKYHDDSIGPSAYSSDSETRTDFGRRESERRRHRSRPRYSESEITATTDHRHRKRGERDREDRDSKYRRRHRHEKDKDSRRERSERERERDDERDEYDGRSSRRRRREEKETRVDSQLPIDPSSSEAVFPLRGGITIPQHIVIPPSKGERGVDGNPLPQKFQINSEITINYDQNSTERIAPAYSAEARRKQAPMQITSNV